MTNNHIHAIFIALNVAIFGLQEVGFDWREWGALWRYDSAYYHVWQWLTHMFLHENFTHILFNMYALGMFGAVFARVWTRRRFLFLYVISGIAGAVLEMPFLAENGVLLGASGAVYGVIAAFAISFPRAPLSLIFIPISFQARYLVAVLVAYEIFAQFSGISLFGENIAHMAHVGGAIMGAVVAYFWQKKVV